MKKVLCILMLLCAVSTGAWADVEYLASFNFASTSDASQNVNGVTVTVVAAIGELTSGTTTYTLTDAQITGLKEHINASSNVITNEHAQTYIKSNTTYTNSGADLNITIGGLTGGAAYNISLVTGCTFEGTGNWNRIVSDNELESSDPALSSNVIKVRELTPFKISSIKANNNGQIILTVDNYEGKHSAVINALAIAQVPADPEPTDPIKVTTDAEHPIWYKISSYSRGGALTSKGSGQSVTHEAMGSNSYWYFTKDTNGGYIFHNADGTQLKNNWQTGNEGDALYILPNGVNDNGLTICKASAISDSEDNCLDASNSNTSVGNWKPSTTDWQGTTWVFTAIEDGVILASMTAGDPDHVFRLHPNNSNTYWLTSELHAGTTGGKFAFYDAEGANNYYIYSAEAGKWVTYTNTDNGGGKLALSDTKDAYFKIEKGTNGGTEVYSFQAYSNKNTVSRFINFYQGIDHPSHAYKTTETVGFWQDQFNDAGSSWVMTEVNWPTDTEVEALQVKITNAINAIQNLKVGYPDMYSDANEDAITALSSKYTTLSGGVTKKNYDYALSAYNAVVILSNINLPEDGKAYTIKAVWQGGEDMLYYDENIGKIKGATNPTRGNLFVCRKTSNGKFLLVNEYGKYLTWGSSTSVNDVNASAVVGEYSEYADVTIAKATARTNGDGNDVTDEGRFGLVTLQAIKYNTNELWYSNYIHGHSTNNFVESGSTNKWYDSTASNRTHMYRIEEVTDYSVNKTTLKTPKVDDGKTYASIYLPYAVELPEGVAAYKVTSTSDASFHLEEISEDGNLPKETGAILVGEDTNMKTLVPCAATPTAQEDNKLGGCKESTLVSSLGMGTVYVLNGGQDSGIGFFPLSSSANLSPYKAYYREENTPVQGFSFNFDEAIMTAIENLSTTGSQKTEVYDLQGRRMQHVQKGLNIVNGRKVIR